MRRQAEQFGCRVVSQAEVESFDLAGSPKTVTLAGEGPLTSRAVVLAPGGVPRKLGLPSEAAFEGRGISYCATCDGDFFTDQDIVVIGGGNSALEESVSLTRYARSVTVIHEFDAFQAQPWAVAEAEANAKIRFLMAQEVRAFRGEDHLEEVVVASKHDGTETVIPATGAFLFIGYLPNTGFLEGVVELTGRGEIVTDDALRTSVPGVFAAGDCRVKRYRQSPPRWPTGPWPPWARSSTSPPARRPGGGRPRPSGWWAGPRPRWHTDRSGPLPGALRRPGRAPRAGGGAP